MFFPIDWAIVKQQTVAHSSYGAEILAAADADDGGLYMKTIIVDLGSSFNLNHVIIVDSESLFDNINTARK